MKQWFKDRENLEEGSCIDLQEGLAELTFDENGLIPVIAQDHETKDILMFAWMNREALDETIETGKMCYWSRSRQSFWRKGESSGHWQVLKELRTDCDGDVILAKIDQTGGACHTLRKSCFYWKIESNQLRLVSDQD